jgi:Amt family ammonium transporter
MQPTSENVQQLLSDMASRIAELESVVSSSSNQVRKLSEDSFDNGDTAWMLTSCALVLFMTIPGLALYYAGMARTKNVLAIVMQCFVITALITFLWLCFGYSLAFGPANSNGTAFVLYGDASRFWLQGMTLNSFHQLAPTIPETVYCIYQLTFAIITPALITGAFADRMKFPSMLVFMTLWHFLVYCPIAHAVWHPSGFLLKYGALDYAGGNVVHISSGISGLVCALYLGHRKGYGKEAFEPHNILLTLVGSSMLWVGWFGFNAGSAGGASHRAGMALLVTQIATGIATLSWTTIEWIIRGKPSVQGTVSGAIAGLVAITPASGTFYLIENVFFFLLTNWFFFFFSPSGYVDQTGAFFIGLIGGVVCYLGAQVKHYLGFDDALDAFGVHAVGGIVGGILTGFFATDAVTGRPNGVFYTDTFYGGRQLGMQLYAITFSVFWSLAVTLAICFIVDKTMGLRVSEADEDIGLDRSIHGEGIMMGGPPSAKMLIETRVDNAEIEMTKAKMALSTEDPDTQDARI